jgi:2-keto-3-deoxy-L-rhamnonate aldolase RhmA
LVRENEVKAKLQRGETAIGTMLFEFFVPGIPRLMATTGAEFAIYDMEHTGMSFETLRVLAAGSRGPSPVPMVRVPATEYHFMARALDCGMLGLMIPMVESGEQARKIVDATRYPPLGRRGAGMGMAQDDYERGEVVAEIEALNERTFIITQIESPAGLENLEDIAATDGIDCLWIGHNDLSIQMGIPGQFESTRFQDAMTRVADVADKYGKPCGVAAGSVAMAEAWMAKGYRAIAFGADHRLFADGLKSGIEKVRTFVKR